MKNSITIPATVSEMASNFKDLDISVPFAPDVNIKDLTKGDDSPLFVTIEVVNAGVSKSKRRYSEKVIHDIADQIKKNKPEAYEGHIKEADRGNARPKPMTLWLGAMTKEIAGKTRLFAKGYVLPYATELKQYLQAAKAAGKKVAVSIYGQANQIWNNLDRVYDISDFALESIDWARDGAEGVPSLGYLRLTSEMHDDRGSILEKLTKSEVEEINPTVVKEIYDEAETTVKEKLEADFDKRVEKAIVAEMKPIKELFGDKKPATVVKEMKTKIHDLRKLVAESIIDKELAERVKNESTRKVLRRMIVAEMIEFDKRSVKQRISEVLESEEGKLVVSEMRITKPSFSPKIDNRQKDEGRKYTVIKGN